MFESILVVCVGNICRSPMAEAVLAHELRARGLSVRVESAGLGALVGRPADPIACELMLERGIDISSHRARQLDSKLARQFQVILVMEETHQKQLENEAPETRGRILRLGAFEKFDVPDPYRRGRAAFMEALSLIERGVQAFVRKGWS